MVARIEYMIVDALLAAEPHLKIADQVYKPEKYVYLTDDIMPRGRKWYDTLSRALTDLSITKSEADHGVFYGRVGDDMAAKRMRRDTERTGRRGVKTKQREQSLERVPVTSQILPVGWEGRSGGRQNPRNTEVIHRRMERRPLPTVQMLDVIYASRMRANRDEAQVGGEKAHGRDPQLVVSSATRLLSS